MKLEPTQIDITARLTLSQREIDVLDHICGYYSSVAEFVVEKCSKEKSKDQISKVLSELWGKTKLLKAQQAAIFKAAYVRQ